MMSTTSSKILCVTCNKAKGTYKCEGCLQIFCPKHSIDHRNDLSKQLEETEVAHDLVQQILIQQTENLRQHPLLQKVDQWEQQSIEKIHQTADEIRNQLIKDATEYTTKIKQKLHNLSDELRQSRDDNDFIETDLQEWTQKLEELKKELINPTTITIQEDSTPLITKICIGRQDTLDIFERVCGNAEIKEDGHLVVSLGGHTEIRGKSEYNTGKHIFRFGIQQLPQNGWISFGVISKSQPMKTNSYVSLSSYGWSNHNQTYAGSQVTNEETIQIIQNDIIILLFDCNQQKIELKNERLNRTKEMFVDIHKCPFPWQFHLNLHATNTNVRILNPSD